MRSIAELVSVEISDWLVPVFILLGTWAAVRATHWLLKRAGSAPKLAFIAPLSGWIARLVYVVGLKLFADTAPLPPKTAHWLESAIYIVGVIIVLGLIRKAAMLGIEWSAFRANPSATLQQGFIPMIRNLVTLFVFATASIMILKYFGYDVLSLLTALGVGSLAVGLAAKDTLSNMISGFTLIIDRNLKAGDRVNLGGQAGEVEEIGLRSTRIRTGSGNTLIVPNSELVNTKILNLSIPTRAMSCTISLRVPHAIPFRKLRGIAESILAELPQRDRAREASVLINSIVETGQNVTVGFWIEDSAKEGVAASEFIERLQAKLEAEGMSLDPAHPVSKT